MTVSFEVLLFLGVVGFYLYDSLVLVCYNEVVLFLWNGRWTARWPVSSWTLAGRHPLLPPPLLPDHLAFRAAWSPRPASAVDAASIDLRALDRAATPLRVLTRMLQGLLFGALPVTLFVRGAAVGFPAVLAAVYLTAAAMVAVTYRRRQAFGLDRRAWARLAFDALVCVPFALNLLRKIGLRQRVCRDPLAFAETRLSPPAYRDLLAAVTEKASEQLEWISDDDGERRAEWMAFLQRLERMRDGNRPVEDA